MQRFFALNRRLCDKIASHLPQTKPDLWEQYEKSVAHYMNAKPKQIVVDIGGGKHCPFARFRNPAMQTHIIGVDISEEELQENHDVDEVRVADAAEKLPFADGEVDMIVSQSLIEHLKDVNRFAKEAFRVLRPGGAFIHLFPSRNAPFILIKRILPHALVQRSLHFIWPESKIWGDFRAYYHQCSYHAIQQLLRRQGFEIIDVEVSYYQSLYYGSFVPLFLLSALYEVIIYKLGLKNLCARILVVATKKRGDREGQSIP